MGVTTAHCYVAVNGEPDVEELIRRRYRALRAYEDAMYQNYVSKLADGLARAIVRGDDADYLTDLSSHIAASYHISSELTVTDVVNNGLPSLRESLKIFREAVHRQQPSDTAGPWGAKVDLILASLALSWGRKCRPTVDSDVLGLLNQSLEMEIGRRDANARKMRESFLLQFDKLTTLLDEAQNIKASLKSLLNYPEAPWDTIRQMRDHSSRQGFPCTASPVKSGDSLVLNGWQFQKGHNFHHDEQCNCDRDRSCRSEVSRRVAFIFDAKAPERSNTHCDVSDYVWESPKKKSDALAFVDFCKESKMSAGNWIKRSAEKGSERMSPSLAALVTLLFLSGCRVKSDQELTKNLTHKARVNHLPNWRLGLAAIAKLSLPDNGDPSQIEIRRSQADVVFILGCGAEDELEYATWFERRRQDAQERPVTPESHSRTTDIAAAYMFEGGLLPKPDRTGRIENVTVRLEHRHLLCVWHDVNWDCG